MSEDFGTKSWPKEIRLKKAEKLLEIDFDDGKSFVYPAEFLRVESPSAEVQGHGPGQDGLQIAKENVSVTALEPVGRYAVKIVFDDGHDSGLYTWAYLRTLGDQYAARWARYLTRLEGIGYVRQPKGPAVTPTE